MSYEEDRSIGNGEVYEPNDDEWEAMADEHSSYEPDEPTVCPEGYEIDLSYQTCLFQRTEGGNWDDEPMRVVCYRCGFKGIWQHD